MTYLSKLGFSCGQDQYMTFFNEAFGKNHIYIEYSNIYTTFSNEAITVRNTFREA